MLDSLLRYARDMQLDVSAFGACLDDPATPARVDRGTPRPWADNQRWALTSPPNALFSQRPAFVQGSTLNPYPTTDYVLFIERTAHTHAPGRRQLAGRRE